jgi:predicted signal transduction protein with EAL and GGDEF domain
MASIPAQLSRRGRCAPHRRHSRRGYHVYQGFEAVEDEVYRGLDLDLERAIRANELEVWYQPQLELESGIAVAAEALVRWRHLKAGEIPPTTVVGIAERTGLMSALNFYILNAALRQASQWRAQDIAPQIAVNLSIGMLTDRELPSVIDQALRTWGAEATQLTLEVAESSMIADAERRACQAPSAGSGRDRRFRPVLSPRAAPDRQAEDDPSVTPSRITATAR